MKTGRSWLPTVIVSLGVLVGVIVLLSTNETAREVAGQSALSVFQILTTPFILETSLALLGLCLVIAINHYRQQNDGDEWVYLEQKTPASNTASNDDPPHRHDAVVWKDKPETFDETAAGLDVMEGYLDLGLAEDALREWSSLPDDAKSSDRAIALHRRAVTMSGQNDDAI